MRWFLILIIGAIVGIWLIIRWLGSPKHSVRTMVTSYHAYRNANPQASHDEALLHAIRWRFNRAIFGSKSPIYGSTLLGQVSDDKIVAILKEADAYDDIVKAAAFVVGMEEHKKKINMP